MKHLTLSAVALLAVSAGLLFGDDPPKKPADTKAESAPAKHALPADWRKLGLSDEQKKKVYAIEDEYEPKLAALRKQIEALQTEEKSKKYEVLTAEQRKQLTAIREAKDGGATKPPEKKP